MTAPNIRIAIGQIVFCFGYIGIFITLFAWAGCIIERDKK